VARRGTGRRRHSCSFRNSRRRNASRLSRRVWAWAGINSASVNSASMNSASMNSAKRQQEQRQREQRRATQLNLRHLGPRRPPGGHVGILILPKRRDLRPRLLAKTSSFASRQSSHSNKSGGPRCGGRPNRIPPRIRVAARNRRRTRSRSLAGSARLRGAGRIPRARCRSHWGRWPAQPERARRSGSKGISATDHAAAGASVSSASGPVDRLGRTSEPPRSRSP
jgi:hypothetical protein